MHAKKFFIFFLLISCLFSSLYAQLKITGLLTENRTNPIGLDTKEPRFTWRLESSQRNVHQKAYQLKVLGPDRKTLKWATGKVESDQSVQIAYQGSPLESGHKYYWQVRVWDQQGTPSAWSERALWQTGILDSSLWKAKWIQPGFTEDSTQPSPLFRKEFNSGKKILQATLYITAHGIYEANLNGERIGDAYLTPGWTAYSKRLQYQVFDLTDKIKNGTNALGISVGNGWYRGYIGFAGQKNYYGKDISLLVQLDLLYADGTTSSIVSDGSWKSSTGAIRSSELYDGETVDLQKDQPGWMLPGFNDKNWSAVKTAEFNFSTLVATYNEPVKKHQVFKAIQLITTPRGEKVIDFGQNLVGWVIMKVKGKAGDQVTLSHAEVLDKSGNFYTDNLRSAKSQDKLILKGDEEEIFEPHFTFHGFRYIRVEGYPGNIDLANFSAVTLNSDMENTGTFITSNPLINQLQHNIQWGQRGNFLDVPTDCPQRDERLGWTGDAQVFSRTAAFNMGVNNFFGKWLKDVAADQSAQGVIPFVIPNVLGFAVGSTGWADACTIIPWNMYLAYGDKKILEEQYESMKKWVEFMHGQSKNDLWNTGFHFGDWLFYRPEDDNDGRSAVTDKYLIAQSFYAFSTSLLVKAATVLGKTEDISIYTDLLSRVKAAYVKEYVTPNGRLVSGTQTAYVLALNFDLLPESLRAQAAARLAENIKSYGNHLTTGFLGTPYLCHVLSRFGYTDIAYKLLLQETYPSWLYPVKMGATTIWERWDGIKPDSTFQTPGMNSYNHYSYGAIGDWMYRIVAGIDTYEDGPGYKHIRIQPHIGGGFTQIAADLKTYYGNISSHWKIDGNNLLFDVEIPPNTSATVFIPANQASEIQENDKQLQEISSIKVTGTEKGYVQTEMGSGIYHFSAKLEKSIITGNGSITDYAGKYKITEGLMTEALIRIENNKLILVSGSKEIPLAPVQGKKDVFSGGAGVEVVFNRNENDQVTGIKLTMGGLNFSGEKE